ncbi:MAG TPA: prepilin-type N-terminal cleavage/methylation domain-containing protein [Candidatus Binatia bacterium]|nr:prepilin-type N-terminal cleavage/methylation domain-containing protein [Candidatus Binatia bacterium]
MISPVGKSDRGFSLFELVLVLLLLGVSMAIVVPNINRGLQDREVRSSALGLAAAARELRSRALADGVPQRLVLNLSQNSYLVARLADVRLPPTIRFVSVDGGESVGRDLKSFYFFPNGSILGGEIVVGGTAQSISYLIRFEPLTGRVEVARAESS